MPDTALRRRATYADLERMPEGQHVEIVKGEIQAFPSPLAGHGDVQLVLGGSLALAFGRGRGGPGGWWIVAEVDVRFGEDDVARPDISGWRRERLPELPKTLPIEVVPDWVCEIVSPSSARRDRIEKPALYLGAGVRHLWLVDTHDQILEALETEGTRWGRIGVWGRGDTPRIPPFTELELDLDAGFGTASA